MPSLPARGAWIEIVVIIAAAAANSSLPARGAWIEILPPILAQREVFGRSPHGERGLKFWLLTAGCFGVGVAPRTGSVD